MNAASRFILFLALCAGVHAQVHTIHEVFTTIPDENYHPVMFSDFDSFALATSASIRSWSGLPVSPSTSHLVLTGPDRMDAPWAKINPSTAIYKGLDGLARLVVGLPDSPTVVQTGLPFPGPPDRWVAVNHRTAILPRSEWIGVLRYEPSGIAFTIVPYPPGIGLDPNRTPRRVNDDQFAAPLPGWRVLQLNGLTGPLGAISITVEDLPSISFVPDDYQLTESGVLLGWRIDDPVITAVSLRKTEGAWVANYFTASGNSPLILVPPDGAVATEYIPPEDPIRARRTLVTDLSRTPSVLGSWMTDLKWYYSGTAIKGDRWVKHWDPFTVSIEHFRPDSLSDLQGWEPSHYLLVNPDTQALRTGNELRLVPPGPYTGSITLRPAYGLGLPGQLPRWFTMGPTRILVLATPTIAEPAHVLQIIDVPTASVNQAPGRANPSSPRLPLRVSPFAPSATSNITIQATAPTAAGDVLFAFSQELDEAQVLVPHDSILYLAVTAELVSACVPVASDGTATLTLAKPVPPDLIHVPFHFQALHVDGNNWTMSDLGLISVGN